MKAQRSCAGLQTALGYSKYDIGKCVRRLGIFDRKGSIAEGKDADVVLTDGQCGVLTICRGNTAYISREADWT